jgi:hypothetical protein
MNVAAACVVAEARMILTSITKAIASTLNEAFILPLCTTREFMADSL